MAINPEQIKTAQQATAASSTDLAKELEEHKEILLKIYENTRKTRRYIMIGKIISIIYFILIVAPIIFAVIYLPPLLKNVAGPYQELLGQTESLKGVDVDKINNILNKFGN